MLPVRIPCRYRGHCFYLNEASSLVVDLAQSVSLAALVLQHLRRENTGEQVKEERSLISTTLNSFNPRQNSVRNSVN